MHARSHTLSVLAIAMFVVGGDALAQSGTRGGGTSSSNQLNRIRNQSIGRGFTSDEMIRLTQQRDQINAPAVGVQTAANRSAARIRNSSRGLGSSSRQRPFSNLNRRPSVSPYLNLFAFDGSFDDNAGALAYQTVVRPQIRQQQFNQQLSREAAQMNARLQAISAQSAFQQQGNQNLAPTGASAGAFRYYSHYYGGGGR